ncbi:MAG: sugar efflux transporter for intercellular exchange-domain-containing protein [Monoraphidium minutum]|nr:MAG: sugar efflux transporter for intercellular exchange-domain-containing protein [Monoraphidium minutum]
MSPMNPTALAFGIAGSVTSTAMYASPLRAVWGARSVGKLGAIDARPFAFSVLCTAAWIAYGFVGQDWMMFLPNIPGLVVSVFCAVASYGMADRKAQNFMLAVLCIAAGVLPLLGVISMPIIIKDHATAVLMYGIAADVITIMYYGSPLMAAWNVIKTRSSASILLPRLLCDIANSGLWTVYGLMKHDPAIIIPNAGGVTLGFILLTLKVLFCRGAPPAEAKDGDDDGNFTAAELIIPPGGDAAVLVSPKGAAAPKGAYAVDITPDAP